MKLSVATPLIIQEYISWASTQKNPDKYVFYWTHLYQNKPHLLKFSCRGDKWQRVNGMLSNFP